MRKFLTILSVGLCALLTACGDGDTEKGNEWFLSPEAVVSGTTADVSCRTKFADGVLASAEVGFVYSPVEAEGAGGLFEADPVYVNANTLSCRLVSLEPETTYLVYAYMDLGSGSQMQSPAVRFKTGKEGDPGAPDAPQFGTPVCSEVTSSSASVSCTFDYSGKEKISEVYFQYSSPDGLSQREDVPPPSPGTKNAVLSKLSASTKYTVRLCAVIGGITYPGPAASFTTAKEADPDPDPDPDPKPGNTLFAGWAELPTTKEKAGDWYYTYHITDVNAPTGKKARNYSVCYSKELKCAVWVAAPMHPFYVQKNTSRTDAYKTDPNIPFTQPGKWTGYTRGHMLGSGERLVSRKTNEQVFYYSNIAPQLGQPYFNTGGGAWNTLEDWVDTQWTNYSDTTYQVIGCHWASGTKKVVNGTTIPTHYYKVLLRTKGHKNKWVQNCTRDELQCIAIMVQHKNYSKNEVPKPNQYESKGMLYSVKEMEQMTGLTFFGNVPNAPKDTYNPSDWGL